MENFENIRLLSEKQGGVYCGLGRNKFREFGQEAKAVRRIGSRVLYDKFALDAAIDRLGESEK